jgi:hypothetical protein
MMTTHFAAFEPILAIAHDPTFWSDYLFLSHSGCEYDSISNYDHVVPPSDLYESPGFTLKSCRLTFPVTEQRGLILDFTCSLDYFGLDLLQSDANRIELGWDDQAGWHPHILRWDELELICKSLSIRDSSFHHPGLPLLLLSRWAPITDTDSPDHILSLLQQALVRVGVNSPETSQSIFTRLDKRGNGFEWKYDSAHEWTLHQDDPFRLKEGFKYKARLYTLRSPENDDFPFAEFNAMLRSAREACANR